MGNGHVEYVTQWRLRRQYCSDRISRGTSFISLLYSVLQFLPYYSVLKMPFTGPLLSKCAPCAFVLSKCLSEVFFQLTLCRRRTHACGLLLACCEPFCSCCWCFCCFTSPWRQPAVLQCVGWSLAVLLQYWCPLTQCCLYRASRKYSCIFVIALRS